MNITQSIIQGGQYFNEATGDTVKVSTFAHGYVTYNLDWKVMGASVMFSGPKKVTYESFIASYECLEK